MNAEIVLGVIWNRGKGTMVGLYVSIRSDTQVAIAVQRWHRLSGRWPRALYNQHLRRYLPFIDGVVPRICSVQRILPVRQEENPELIKLLEYPRSTLELYYVQVTPTTSILTF